MKKILTDSTRKEFLDALEVKIGRKLLFIDLDGVVADFDLGAEKWAKEIGITAQEFKDRKMYRQPDFYYSLELMPGAKKAIENLSVIYEIRFLSAPSWGNPSSFTEKRLWIDEKFGSWAKKRMDLTFRKDLSIGHFLVDDRIKYGAADFIGQHIMFGTDPFKTWPEVDNYLISQDFLLVNS